MTQKANPSINRPAEAYKTAGAIAYGGHGDSGFIVEGATPTDISTQDAGINETNLEAFRLNNQYSSSSFDVTIDPGEAFVFGSWIAKDQQTTVTLASDTTGQTVYAGWNKSGPDDVIVGLDAALSSAGGDTDEKIPLHTFDTDTNGVTNVTDDRQIGRKVDAENVETQNLTLAGNTLDSDGDGVFDNADVNALTSLSQGDSFSGYPLNAADISQLDSSITEIVEYTSGNVPAAGTDGRIIIESDTGRILFDNGSSLVEIGLSEGEISHDNINGVSASDHHAEPSAGTAITDEGSNQFGLDTSTSVSFANGIDSLPEPTDNNDAARKEYVDSVASGLNLKDSVAVSNHDQNIDLTSTTDPNPIDSYTLQDGERILLKHQTDAVENGIYDAVDATDPTTWVRSDDMDEDSEVTQGAFTFIRNGSHQNESYVVTSSDPLTVGTDPIEWSQFSAAGELSAGTGLSKTNSTFSITQDGVTSTELAGDIDGADHSTEYFDESDTGVIADGDFGILMTTTLADNQYFRITRAGFHSITDSSPVGASPSSADFKIINEAGDTTLKTILSGDGTTAFTQETGSPQTTYQNTTGSSQTIVIGVDNGQVDTNLGGSDIEIQSAIIGRIE